MIQIINNDIESVRDWYCGEIKPIIETWITEHTQEINDYCKEKQTVRFDIDAFLMANLKEILIAEPLRLIEIHDEWVKGFCTPKIGDTLLKKYNDAIRTPKKDRMKEQNSITKHFEHYSKIFNYESGVKNLKKIKYDLLQKLNVKVCPYCNRNYTLTLKKAENGVNLRPDFDHFFAKSMYPILALSFYNLIPSCAICNRNLKGSEEFSLKTHCHPYLEDFGTNATFQYNPKSVNQALGIDDCCEIKLDIEPNTPKDMREKIEKNIEVFGLNGIYSEHGDIVAEIITKYYKTNGKYLESLEQLFNGKVSSSELYRLAFGNYEKEVDFGKRPMAKLTSDIVKQLKLDKRFR